MTEEQVKQIEILAKRMQTNLLTYEDLFNEGQLAVLEGKPVGHAMRSLVRRTHGKLLDEVHAQPGPHKPTNHTPGPYRPNNPVAIPKAEYDAASDSFTAAVTNLPFQIIEDKDTLQTIIDQTQLSELEHRILIRVYVEGQTQASVATSLLLSKTKLNQVLQGTLSKLRRTANRLGLTND